LGNVDSSVASLTKYRERPVHVATPVYLQTAHCSSGGWSCRCIFWCGTGSSPSHAQWCLPKAGPCGRFLASNNGNGGNDDSMASWRRGWFVEWYFPRTWAGGGRRISKLSAFVHEKKGGIMVIAFCNFVSCHGQWCVFSIVVVNELMSPAAGSAAHLQTWITFASLNCSSTVVVKKHRARIRAQVNGTHISHMCAHVQTKTLR
jgi:hypothetical protein